MKYHDAFAIIRLLALILGVVLIASVLEAKTNEQPPEEPIIIEIEEPTPPPEPEPQPEIQPEPEPDPEPRYALTDAERHEIEQVVMAEAGGESFDGQRAVAQCILNAAELDGIRPTEAVVKYKYTPTRKTPTESVQAAVSAVFDDGDFPIDDTPLWFYAPARVTSKWHEKQRFVAEIGGHRFFAKWS